MNGRREDFRHDRSPYERPSQEWRCGRSVAWGRPCTSGPGPGGTCPHRDLPCAPQRADAPRRGRLAALAAVVAVAVIALLLGDASRRLGLPSSVDAGPLSAPHAAFVGEAGCTACHAAHGQGASAWATEAWRALRQGGTAAIDQACTACHGFGGRETLAHNATLGQREGTLPSTRCVACHTEHKGTGDRGARMSDAVCASCHDRQGGSFLTAHPPFAAGYPHQGPGAALFNHASHFGKHFANPRSADRAPAGGCLGCHGKPDGAGAIPKPGYAQACAGCHDAGIAKRELLLVRWPEMPADTRLPKGCGPGPRSATGDPVSLDPPNPLLAWLLGVPADDPQAYVEPLRAFGRETAAGGTGPLAAAAAIRLGKEGEPLLRGLAGETARLAACAWMSNREYEPPSPAPATGWHAEALELRYVRPRHGDPVLRAWLDALAAVATPAEPQDAQRLEAVRAEFLSADGPGQCLKCHVATGKAGAPRQINWAAGAPAPRQALHLFDHRPHVTSAPSGSATCATCHKVATVADGAVAVGEKPAEPRPGAQVQASARATALGLAPIARETCASCHQPGKVAQDCLTCHAYHQGHTLKPREPAHAR